MHPYLEQDRICEWLASSINKASITHDFAVLAYVFMPDHAHLLIHPMREVYEMEWILKSIKQGPSRRAKNRGLISTNLWEPGGGYDSNVFNQLARREIIEYIVQNPVRKSLTEDPLDYPWSSAKWLVTGGHSPVQCHSIYEVWGY